MGSRNSKHHVRLMFTSGELTCVIDILCLRSLGWPPVHSVAKDGLKLPTLLPLPPEDYRGVPPCWDLTFPTPLWLFIDCRCEVKPSFTGTVDLRRDMEVKYKLKFHYTQWSFLNFFCLRILCKLVCPKRKIEAGNPGVFGLTCWASEGVTNPLQAASGNDGQGCLFLSSQPWVIAHSIPDLP